MIDRLDSRQDGVGELPSIEQLREYRDLMVGIVRQQGRGVRYARMGERAPTRIGTEYMLPGAMTDWSIPDKKWRTQIMRERRYSASYREGEVELADNLSVIAGRLLVLESDSVRVGDMYETKRNLYRFGWNELLGVYEADVLPVQIILDAQTDMEIVANPASERVVVTFDHERTVAGTDPEESKGYYRYVNPMRDTESPWQAVTEVQMDGLLRRTDEYGQDLLEP
jgi:hypothetical protein